MGWNGYMIFTWLNYISWHFWSNEIGRWAKFSGTDWIEDTPCGDGKWLEQKTTWAHGFCLHEKSLKSQGQKYLWIFFCNCSNIILYFIWYSWLQYMYVLLYWFLMSYGMNRVSLESWTHASLKRHFSSSIQFLCEKRRRESDPAPCKWESWPGWRMCPPDRFLPCSFERLEIEVNKHGDWNDQFSLMIFLWKSVIFHIHGCLLDIVFECIWFYWILYTWPWAGAPFQWSSWQHMGRAVNWMSPETWWTHSKLDPAPDDGNTHPRQQLDNRNRMCQCHYSHM